MPLKESFLAYVELQRAANAAREAYGINDERTVKAYDRANEMKRSLIVALEKVESCL